MAFTKEQCNLIKEAIIDVLQNYELDEDPFNNQQIEMMDTIAKDVISSIVQKSIDESLLRREKNEEQKMEDPNHLES